MCNVKRDDIISAVAQHNIRWIRKNFYLGKCINDLSVNILLDELTEYHKVHDKGKGMMLPKTLIDFYDNYYANDYVAIEDLKEKLIYSFICDKHILLLHENYNDKYINSLKKTFCNAINCEKVEFESEPSELIDLLKKSNKVDFAILCLSNANNETVIVSILAYLIGFLGSDNVCVIYDEDKNEKIFAIIKKFGITCDTYLGLGIRGNK